MEPTAAFWTRFAASVLATWRLAELLANEDGPADIMVRLRARAQRRFLGRLMDCFQCVSLWVAAPFAFFAAGVSRDWPVAWLAISAGACLIERWCPAREPAARVDAEDSNDELLRTETRALEISRRRR